MPLANEILRPPVRSSPPRADMTYGVARGLRSRPYQPELLLVSRSVLERSQLSDTKEADSVEDDTSPGGPITWQGSKPDRFRHRTVLRVQLPMPRGIRNLSVSPLLSEAIHR